MAKKKQQFLPRPSRNVVANQFKNYQFELNANLPAVYACMALALSECTNMSGDDISYIMAYSQKIWQKHENAPSLMLKECYDKTGIMLMRGEGWDD